MSTDDEIPANDLDALRALILGDDGVALRSVGELSQRLEAAEERLRDDPLAVERLRAVLGEVLQGLEGDERRLVQDRLTALLLTNIQREITAAKPRFIQSIYPIAGELVQRGIQQAIAELMETIEDRLREPATIYKRAQIRIESLITRKSEAEIWLRQTGIFHVERILLVDRTSGTVIAGLRQDRYGAFKDNRTAAEDVQGEDQIVSGMLTAIMSFSQEAFGGGTEGELSTLEFENSQLHLKATPAILLVVRIIGTPPPKIDALIDERFNRLLRDHPTALESFDGTLSEDAYAEIGVQLRRFLLALNKLDGDPSARSQQQKQRSGVTFVSVLAGVIFAALLMIAILNTVRINGNVTRVQDTIESVENLQAYPIQAEYDREKASVMVRGLVPDAASAGLLETRLRDSHPRLALTFALSNIATDAVRPNLRGSRIEREANSASVNELRDEAFIRDTIIFDLEQQIRDLRSLIAGTEAIDAAMSYPTLRYDLDPDLAALRDQVGGALLRALEVRRQFADESAGIQSMLGQTGAVSLQPSLDEIDERTIAGTLIGFNASGSFTDVPLAREAARLVAELAATKAEGTKVEILTVVRSVTGQERPATLENFIASKTRALLITQGLSPSQIVIRTGGASALVSEINPSNWRRSHYVGFRLAY